MNYQALMNHSFFLRNTFCASHNVGGRGCWHLQGSHPDWKIQGFWNWVCLRLSQKAPVTMCSIRECESQSFLQGRQRNGGGYCLDWIKHLQVTHWLQVEMYCWQKGIKMLFTHLWLESKIRSLLSALRSLDERCL